MIPLHYRSIVKQADPVLACRANLIFLVSIAWKINSFGPLKISKKHGQYVVLLRNYFESLREAREQVYRVNFYVMILYICQEKRT